MKHTIPSSVRRARLLVLLACTAVGSASADNGGSGYSRYGIGDLSYFGTSRSLGMGGAGLSVLSTASIDRMNPGAWTEIIQTRFSVGMQYEGVSTTDGVNSSYRSTAIFNGFMVAFPLAPRSGVVVAVGMMPYSRINYNVITPGGLGGLDYHVQYIGDGGVSVGKAGVSARFGDDYHLGATLDYYFGNLNYTTDQTFGSSAYTSATVIRSLEVRGIGVTFGGVYSGLAKVLHLAAGESFNVGLTFSTAASLTSSEERFFSYNTSTLVTRDTVPSPDQTMHIPFAIGGGVSYLSSRWLLAADAYYQQWSRYSLDGAADPNLRDGFRASFGAELLPIRDPSASFRQHLAYRFGGYYDASYYRVMGQAINEIGVTAGIGFPLIGETRLNVSAQAGFRGTTADQLQQDRIYRIGLILSGGEIWFLRPPEE